MIRNMGKFAVCLGVVVFCCMTHAVCSNAGFLQRVLCPLVVQSIPSVPAFLCQKVRKLWPYSKFCDHAGTTHHHI